MKEETVLYKSADTTCRGFLAYDPTKTAKSPAVIVIHAWRGLDDFSKQKARMLAELGYVGFSADLYGAGATATTDDKAYELMSPLFVDRKLLRERMVSAYETIKAMPFVDANRIGAIGFCFGGLSAIELFRSGVDLRGVVSFHALMGTTIGDLQAQAIPSTPSTKSSILMLHGHDDPYVSRQDIENITKEFTEAKVDWQMHLYSHTSHAFTNPQANDPTGALKYNPLSDQRSWLEMTNFFEEVFK